MQMQQMLRAMGQKDIPAPKPTLEINPDHEIVKEAAGASRRRRRRGCRVAALRSGSADGRRAAAGSGRLRPAPQPRAEPQRMQAAELILTKALKFNPASSMGHLDLGIVYVETDRKNDAMRELLMATKLAPQDVAAHFRLAQLYRSMGRAAEAKAEFDKAKSINKATNKALLYVMSEAHTKDKPAAPTQ
jgi:tetratricopeptide (TPR) repeat protein